MMKRILFILCLIVCSLSGFASHDVLLGLKNADIMEVQDKKPKKGKTKQTTATKARPQQKKGTTTVVAPEKAESETAAAEESTTQKPQEGKATSAKMETEEAANVMETQDKFVMLNALTTSPGKGLNFSSMGYNDTISTKSNTATINLEMDFPYSGNAMLDNAITKWMVSSMKHHPAWGSTVYVMDDFTITEEFDPYDFMSFYAEQLTAIAQKVLDNDKQDFRVKWKIKFLDEGKNCITFNSTLEYRDGQTSKKMMDVMTFRTPDGKLFSGKDILKPEFQGSENGESSHFNAYLNNTSLCLIGDTQELNGTYAQQSVDLGKAKRTVRVEALAMVSDDLGAITIGGINYFVSPQQAVVVKQHGLSGTVNVPEKINAYGWNYNVKELEPGCFMDCDGLTSVKLPSNLTQIPDSIFFGCTSLEKVQFPARVKEIGAMAFANCQKLSELALPSSVEKLDSAAFFNTGLATITMDGVKTIGDRCFASCPGLRNVKLPIRLTGLGEAAFMGCSGITDISIPVGVKELSDSLFYGCSSLKKVNFHNEVSSIGENCFQNTAISDFFMPEKTRIVKKAAFADVKSLNRISCSAVLETLEDDCFSGTSISAVTFPASLVKIGSGCFKNCANMNFVLCLWMSPAETAMGGDVFTGISPEAELYVPKGAKKFFKKKPEWQPFKNIKTIDDKDITQTQTIRPTTEK